MPITEHVQAALPLAVELERCQRSLRAFVERAWPIIEPATRFVPGYHIDGICEHLQAVTEGQIQRLLINCPPRVMKSILVAVLWPAWEWSRRGDGPGRLPAASRWLFASYAADLATRDSVKCRRVIDSPWYQQRWGERFTLTSDQNVKTRFENDKTGVRLTTSVGGSATGEGGDRIVVDDPHNVTTVGSDTTRESTLRWWDETMASRANDPKTSAWVIVMQRVHHADLAAHVLDQGGYEHLCLPMEYEPSRSMRTTIGWQDPRRTDGELLWPVRFGPAEVAQLKANLGSFAYAAQCQQQPSPREGAIIKREWCRKFWSVLPTTMDEWVASWDLAFTDSPSASYVVGQVWGRLEGQFYLVDQYRARLSFVESLTAVETLWRRWPAASAKLVEEHANGVALMDTLKLKVPGLIPVEPRGSKEGRLTAVSPAFEAGNVILPDPAIAPWVHDYIEELCTVPAAEHWDQADATSQALDRLLHSRQKPQIYSFGGRSPRWTNLTDLSELRSMHESNWIC